MRLAQLILPQGVSRIVARAGRALKRYGRRRSDLSSPAHWLVLPDEAAPSPRPEPILMPQPSAPTPVARDWSMVRAPIHHDLGPNAVLPSFWLSRDEAIRLPVEAETPLGGFADVGSFPVWQLAPETRGEFLFN